MGDSKRHTRRSELSFAGATNGSLDDDYVLQLNLDKDIKTIENSYAGCIQNILIDFDNKITQEKALKAGRTTAKKTSKASKESIEKCPITSSIKYQTSDVPGTSSNASSTVKRKTTNKRSSVKPRQTSKTVEEMNPQENVYDIDNMKEDIPNLLKTNVKKNVNEISKKIKKTTVEKKSTTKNMKLNIEDSENKATIVQRKSGQKASRKNAKVKQDENIKSLPDEKKKNNKKKNVNANNKITIKKYTVNKGKMKLKKTFSINKCQENTQANKLPLRGGINDVKIMKENSKNVVVIKRREENEKIKKAAQAIENLSQYITIKMRSIKNDLESTIPNDCCIIQDSEYSSRYTTDSSESCSCSSTNCECSHYNSDNCEDSDSFESYTSSSNNEKQY